jgi:ATP-dependent Clp protease protease subunit
LDDEACNQLIASLAWLQGQSSTEPITLYFNVPGSLGKPAFAVYDMMQKMTCPLITINCGLTVGMGALLCASGSKGQRYALPNSRFLMSKTGLDDGLQGQAVGLSLGVKEVMKDNEVIISELARLCGHPRLKIEMDLTRDFYLTATEASMYGVVDSVRMPPRPFKLKWYRGSDDDVVGFGHFAEVSKVKAGPNDEVLQLSEENEEEFDDYTMREMMKKGAKGDGTLDTSRGSAERFGSSRCRPIPLAPKDKTPKKPTNGDREEDEFDKNPFKNVF